MFKQLLTLIFVSLAVCASARPITPDEATAVATEFLNSLNTSKSSLKKSGVQPVRKQKTESTENSSLPFYVFNADGGDGFVIVAGDNRAKKILGYSDTGSFDFNNLPPQLAAMLEQYKERVESFPETGEPDPSWNMHVRSTSNNEGKLLKTANWGQSYPYNAQCPEVDQNKCLTGCVATAMAIIMKYHNWPNQGQGSVEYQWDGHQLSASFDSSVYDWSKMHDEYNNDVQYSNDEINEIAHLMHDVGVSIKANYGTNATYASDRDACVALGENFRFHPGLGSVCLFYCNWEYFFSVVKSEIDNDRPLLFSSLKTPNGADPHSYVGDGYDAQGYVHFNWGWDGYANGYYSIDPIKGIFGPDFYCNYGIAPTNLPRPQLLDGPMVGSCGNFSYWIDGLIHCKYSSRYYGTTDSLKVTGGYVVKNNITGEEIYCEYCDLSPAPLEMGGVFTQDVKMNLTIQLPDGEYIIYPAYQELGREWQRCMVSDLYQSSIGLKVLDGKKIFSNNPPPISSPSQGVEIDGIYYNLDDERMTAEVTFRNELYNSYYDDITIPSHISFNDNEYRVNSIGDYAFRECHSLGNIILPPTIESIGVGSFMDVCYRYVNLGELDNLTTIKQGAFYFNWIAAGSSKEYCRPISLPKNLQSIGKYAFMNVNFGLLEIPESVTKIDTEGLARNNIDAIKFTRTDLSDVSFSETAFNDGNHYNPSTFPILLFPDIVMEDYLALDAFQNYDIVKGYKDEIIQAKKFDIYYKGNVLPEDTVIYANPLETIEFESRFFPENPTIEETIWYVKENDDPELGDYATHNIPLENGVYKYQIWHYNNTSIDDQYTGFEHQVICATRDGSELKRRFKIIVYADIKTITLNQQEIDLQIGESNKLDFSVFPANVNTELINWNSSNPEVATVDQSGNVIAIAGGTTIVTVTAASGVSASCHVTVLTPEKGDSNVNGTVNIADAVNTANYAVGIEVEKFYFEAADVNEDNSITLADASGTVTIILNQPVDFSAPDAMRVNKSDYQDITSDRLLIEDYSIGIDSGISVTLENSIDYVALQADVRVPSGMTLQRVEQGNGAVNNHLLLTKRIDDRTMRIVLFDPNNMPFANTGEPLLKLIVNGETYSDDIEIANIIASDADGNEYRLKSVTGHNSDQSGINPTRENDIHIDTLGREIILYNACGHEVTVYSVDGRTVARFTPSSDKESLKVGAGMYIVAVGDKVTSVIVK